MMENLNKFSLRRTAALTGKVAVENPKMFIMRLLLLVGAMTLGPLFINIVNIHSYSRSYDGIIDIELGYFAMMLFVLGLIYTSLAFNEVKNKRGRVSLLMLPCLNSEKYIARFMVYIPIFLLVFIVSMFVADALRVLVVSALFPSMASQQQFLSIDDIINVNMSATLAIFLLLQSFYWLGAILWPSNSLIKTFAAFAVVCFLYFIVYWSAYRCFVHGESICRVPMFDAIKFAEPIHLLWYCTAFICIVNYCIAYLRLKETDVIQRLL